MRLTILAIVAFAAGCVETNRVSGSDVEDLTGGTVDADDVWHLGNDRPSAVLISVPGTATSLTLMVTGGSGDSLAVRAPVVGSDDAPAIAVVRACWGCATNAAAPGATLVDAPELGLQNHGIIRLVAERVILPTSGEVGCGAESSWTWRYQRFVSLESDGPDPRGTPVALHWDPRTVSYTTTEVIDGVTRTSVAAIREWEDEFAGRFTYTDRRDGISPCLSRWTGPVEIVEPGDGP